MSNRKPLSTVSTGKPGRPVQVRNLARSLIQQMIRNELIAAGIIPPSFPLHKIDSACKHAAQSCIDVLRDKGDLYIIPGSLCRELALIAREPMKPDDPAPLVHPQNVAES